MDTIYKTLVVQERVLSILSIACYLQLFRIIITVTLLLPSVTENTFTLSRALFNFIRLS